MDLPLQDVRVLDLSRVLAGPLGSMILADLGADTIRIEAPGGTDDIRSWSPFIENESTYYLSANRNKRSITINLKTSKGKKLFEKIVTTADVVVENFKTGTLERLGLHYNDLKKINPKIILCSITSYGQDGPYKDYPGYDPVIQAIGGLMHITGTPEGEPTRVGTPVVDIMTSHYVAISVLAALRTREFTGKGQHIDLSLLDVQVGSLANIASRYLMLGEISERVGNAHGNIAPYEVFQCKDKPLMIAAGNDRLFGKLCLALGHPEWFHDERFRTNADRVRNRNKLIELLQGKLQQQDASTWETILSDNGIPCGSINNVEDVFNHPQVKARRMVDEINHPTVGLVRTVRSPMRFSDCPVSVRKHPPLLGEHTDDFFREELGLSESELNQLKEEGVI